MLVSSQEPREFSLWQESAPRGRRQGYLLGVLYMGTSCWPSGLCECVLVCVCTCVCVCALAHSPAPLPVIV